MEGTNFTQKVSNLRLNMAKKKAAKILKKQKFSQKNT
jgi:hypothetical protein